MIELYASALGLSALVTSGVSVRLFRNIQKFQPPAPFAALPAEVDLPSVTVCIPARNEAHALAYCLEKVVASRYEKLEIIVLDDVSGDDTSSLIKSFASEGVRFVKGTPLPEGWLGKNHALQGLLEKASGSYILFIDVDTHLAPQSVETLVRYALSQRLVMVSALPCRVDGWRASVFFSPLRYFWEVVASRRNEPATASSAWLIQRKALLQSFNGFTNLKAAIQPEAKIAAKLSETNQYRFLTSDVNLGVAYEKKWRSQLVTSVRLLYPLCRQNAFFVIALVALLALLATPYAISISGLFLQPFTILHWFALVVAITLSVTYGYYASKVWAKGAFIGGLLFPIIILQEIVLVCASFMQYKRKTVQWKGRPIRTEVQN